jgi:hypothetical protein
MTIPVPPTPPLPAGPGDFERVRRAALLRKLRLPAAGVASLLAVVLAVALTSGGAPRPSDSLTVASASPTATAVAEETASPGPTPTPSPTSSPATAVVAPTTGPLPTPTPTSPPTLASYEYCRTGTTAGADITGDVVDEAGRPLADMTLTGLVCDGHNSYDGRRVAVTDAQGHFRIPCYHHWTVIGPYEWYTADRSSTADVGYAWMDGFFGPVPCGAHQRVVLPPGGTLELTVVDADGNPVSDVTYGVGLFDARDEVTSFAHLRPGPDGKVSFTGLPPGRFFVYASPEKYEYFRVAKGQTVQVTYVLKSRHASPSPSPSGSPTPAPAAS